jgi:DNA (cytosine-5)-methyltransferase 1
VSDVQPTHLDLFSGIGGFALAARWAGFRTVAFSEIEPYAAERLRERWPNVPNVGDVRNAIGLRANLVTGGFPCQPYSFAGERRGNTDDRALWPSMRDVIAESGATGIVAENVPGIIGMALDGVLSDLEAIGYACRPIVIPACAVNAKHRRDRVWIVGYSDSNRQSTGPVHDEMAVMPKAGNGIDSQRCGLQGRKDDAAEGREQSRTQQLPGHVFADVGDAVSTARVWRASHGVPTRLDAARNRAIGNAIVPQVAYEILKAIRGTFR